MSSKQHNRISIKQAVVPVWHFVSSLSLLVLVLLSIGMIAVSKIDSNITRKIRTSVVDFSSPVIAFASKPVVTFHSMKDNFYNYFDAYNHNKQLLSRNVYLENVSLIAAELKLENQRLRGLLQHLPEQAIFYKTARLIADNTGVYSKSGIINSGENDGLKQGQLVTTKDGLVGRLYDVGNKSSRVLYITDISSRVPVSVGANGQRAILAGNNSADMSLKFISEDANIAVGDKVITSADGEFFPAGMAVGVVRSIMEDKIIVQPYVRWSNLEYVTIADIKIVAE